MEDKVAEEKTGVKDGTTRDGDDIPVSTCVGVAAGTGGVLDEEVNGKHQVGTDGDQREEPNNYYYYNTCTCTESYEIQQWSLMIFCFNC